MHLGFDKQIKKIVFLIVILALVFNVLAFVVDADCIVSADSRTGVVVEVEEARIVNFDVAIPIGPISQIAAISALFSILILSSTQIPRLTMDLGGTALKTRAP